MKIILKIVLFILLFTACDDSNQPIDENIRVTPTFITRLNPIDDTGASSDVSLNVIQGIAAFENGWFVTQKSGTSILLINYLDANGVSLFHKRLAINSHGQDLSLEQTEENQLYLFTTKGTFGGTRNTGMLKLKVTLAPKINNVRDWSLTEITPNDEYLLNYTNATPTLSVSKQKFAIRSNNTILTHNKSSIELDDYTPLSHFELVNSQLVDNENFSMWFQGIAMKNEIVYCLTGNQRITSHKKIYAYNQDGMVINKYLFDTADFTQDFYDKFEPEGLTFIDNDLYFTIMTKSETEAGNIKNLYKITI
jgi:hypothetical protein